MDKKENNLDMEKMLKLIKILESNDRLLHSYRKINKKINDIEDVIHRKLKDSAIETEEIQKIMDSVLDNYYKISKNCLS